MLFPMSVGPLAYSKTYERILMKFFGGVRCGQRTIQLDFGDDPDYDPDSEIL